jgi:hypothetical protein
MNDEQAAAFLRNPFANAAIALRHWDDEAKVPGLRVPDAAYYLPILRAAASRKGALVTKQNKDMRNIAPLAGDLQRTTEVSIWRSGIFQYCLRSRSFSAANSRTISKSMPLIKA